MSRNLLALVLVFLVSPSPSFFMFFEFVWKLN